MATPPGPQGIPLQIASVATNLAPASLITDIGFTTVIQEGGSQVQVTFATVPGLTGDPTATLSSPGVLTATINPSTETLPAPINWDIFFQLGPDANVLNASMTGTQFVGATAVFTFSGPIASW